MSEQLLQIRNLSLNLDDQLILENINCDFPKGCITTIIGPSGAGKSSLLKSIVRLFPASGDVIYNQRKLSKIDLRAFRKEVIYVSQVPVVFPGTVAENINWGRSIWELPDVEVTNYLELVGLPREIEDKSAKNLSVGQQQRLHLARSLALEPKVLLLDEPASSLDAISKEAFEQLIFKLQEQFDDLTVVMITHDLSQAIRMADYAVLVDKGVIKIAAPSAEFFDKLKDQTEAEMLQQLLDKKEEST